MTEMIPGDQPVESVPDLTTVELEDNSESEPQGEDLYEYLMDLAGNGEVERLLTYYHTTMAPKETISWASFEFYLISAYRYRLKEIRATAEEIYPELVDAGISNGESEAVDATLGGWRQRAVREVTKLVMGAVNSHAQSGTQMIINHPNHQHHLEGTGEPPTV